VGLALAVSGPWPAAAQIPPGRLPTPSEAERLLREQPELVRRQLQQSGMSEAEIRALLRSRGLPDNALDAFFEPTPLDSMTVFSPDALTALEEVGVFEETADGLVLVPVRTGMQPRERERARADSLARRVFGLDVFTRASSQFQPLLFGPVPDSYRVGPGDQLVLVLSGEVELAHQLTVNREGFLVIPSVGQLPVANLTMSDLRTLLRTRLGASYSGIERGTTTFSVTVAQLRTNQIYVIGEVTQPGAYQLASVATVLNALYAAGGPTEEGNMRNVQVRKRNGDQHLMDLYPYLLAGDVSGDVVLDQGDVVFVPLKGRRVQLVGAVVRPAFYELSRADDLVDVLSAAGGFAPEALRRSLTIFRVLRPADRGPGLSNRRAVDLALRPAADSTEAGYLGGVIIPPVGLQDGDSIVVDTVPGLEKGYYVTIGGEVMSPGQFAWTEGMTVRDLVALSRGPTVAADLRTAEVARMPADRDNGLRAELIRVPLDSSYLAQRDVQGRFRGPPGVAFPPAGASPEFVLEPYDQVTIPPQPDFDVPGSVAVVGDVAVPGPYALLTTTDRVVDLIERAGGVLPTGYVEGARLIRSVDELGRMDLDLAAALEDPDGDENLVLQPGDSLVVPEYSPTVRVTGAVNSPVTVRYVPGEGLGYYIANAGGYRNDADEGRVSVRYANGSARTRSRFLFISSYPTPGPGSEVLVPSRDPTIALQWIEILGPLVAAVGSVTALIIAVTN
jgi:protein involved in polysaccharide export with SLBB domain